MGLLESGERVMTTDMLSRMCRLPEGAAEEAAERLITRRLVEPRRRGDARGFAPLSWKRQRWFTEANLRAMDPGFREYGAEIIRELLELRRAPHIHVVAPRELPAYLEKRNRLSWFVKYLFPALDLRIGNVCNAKCIYCNIGLGPRTWNMDIREIAAVMQRARNLHIEKVAFTGGEPTIRKDFPRITTLAKKMGFRHVNLNTNALVFAYSGTAGRLRDRGVDSAGFSLDTVDTQLADYLFQRSGAGEALLSGVENLFDAFETLLCICVITKINMSALADVVDHFARLVDKYGTGFMLNFDMVQPASMAWVNRREVVPRMTDAAEHVAKALDRAVELGLPVSHRGIPACIMGEYDELCFDNYMHIFRMYETKGGGSRFSANYRNLVFRLGPGCADCAKHTTCQGYHAGYARMFGEGEFAPVGKKKGGK